MVSEHSILFTTEDEMRICNDPYRFDVKDHSI
jgi:hypothetical protein